MAQATNNINKSLNIYEQAAIDRYINWRLSASDRGTMPEGVSDDLHNVVDGTIKALSNKYGQAVHTDMRNPDALRRVVVRSWHALETASPERRKLVRIHSTALKQTGIDIGLPTASYDMHTGRTRYMPAYDPDNPTNKLDTLRDQQLRDGLIDAFQKVSPLDQDRYAQLTMVPEQARLLREELHNKQPAIGDADLDRLEAKAGLRFVDKIIREIEAEPIGTVETDFQFNNTSLSDEPTLNDIGAAKTAWSSGDAAADPKQESVMAIISEGAEAAAEHVATNGGITDPDDLSKINQRAGELLIDRIMKTRRIPDFDHSVIPGDEPIRITDGSRAVEQQEPPTANRNNAGVDNNAKPPVSSVPLREALDSVLSVNPDFSAFVDALGKQGIRLAVEVNRRGAVSKLSYVRDSKVTPAIDLGEKYNWHNVRAVTRYNKDTDYALLTKYLTNGQFNKRTSDFATHQYQAPLDHFGVTKGFGNVLAYYHKGTGRTAFVDKGDEIILKSIRSLSVAAAIAVAKQKGWPSISVHGDKSVRREMWVQAQLQGMAVINYKPSLEDNARLMQVRNARSLGASTTSLPQTTKATTSAGVSDNDSLSNVVKDTSALLFKFWPERQYFDGKVHTVKTLPFVNVLTEKQWNHLGYKLPEATPNKNVGLSVDLSNGKRVHLIHVTDLHPGDVAEANKKAIEHATKSLATHSPTRAAGIQASLSLHGDFHIGIRNHPKASKSAVSRDSSHSEELGL